MPFPKSSFKIMACAGALSALITVPALAGPDTVTFSATDNQNNVSISGSFTIISGDTVSSSSDVSAFNITFTPTNGNTNPGASFDLSAFSPTPTNDYFTYTPSNLFAPLYIEADNSTTPYQGFSINLNMDGANYTYGVGGTQYSGPLGYTISDPYAAPEPATLPLVGVALAGLALLRRRRRHCG